VIRGEIYGNIYLTEKQGAAEFDAEDERALVLLAAVVVAPVAQLLVWAVGSLGDGASAALFAIGVYGVLARRVKRRRTSAATMVVH
jgi:hypothetical protein